MIGIIDCSECKHRRPLLDGWKSCCDAFPNGRPFDFDYSAVKHLKECNNGIKFEKEEKA